MTSRLERLVNRAGRSEQQLAAAITPTIENARQSWIDAGAEASDFLRLIIENNPTKTIQQILARPDVQSALRVPFEEARDNTLAGINVAWDTGVASGRVAAQQDINILGLGNAAGAPNPSTTYRTSLRSDVRGNTTSARNRFRAAIQASGHDTAALRQEFDRITRDTARRSAIGVNSSGHRAHIEAKEELFAYISEQSGVAVSKVWVTRFRPTTCRTCARLHGRRIELRGRFEPYGPGLVYGDLIGPPRHPHCGCRIVPWIDDMAHDTGVGIPQMLAFAANWIADMFRRAS